MSSWRSAPSDSSPEMFAPAGISSTAPVSGSIYHTYSTYSRGLDILWGSYQWLDRAPKGRNETGIWWRRHDEYEAQARTTRAACCA